MILQLYTNIHIKRKFKNVILDIRPISLSLYRVKNS